MREGEGEKRSAAVATTALGERCRETDSPPLLRQMLRRGSDTKGFVPSRSKLQRRANVLGGHLQYTLLSDTDHNTGRGVIV